MSVTALQVRPGAQRGRERDLRAVSVAESPAGPASQADRLGDGGPNLRLAALMAEAGLSRAGLGRQVVAVAAARGMTRRYDHVAVSRWLSGATHPRGEIPAVVADVLSAYLGRPVTITDCGLRPGGPARSDVIAALLPPPPAVCPRCQATLSAPVIPEPPAVWAGTGQPNPRLAALLAATGWTAKAFARQIRTEAATAGLQVKTDHGSVARWLAGAGITAQTGVCVTVILSRRLRRAITPEMAGWTVHDPIPAPPGPHPRPEGTDAP